MWGGMMVPLPLRCGVGAMADALMLLQVCPAAPRIQVLLLWPHLEQLI